MRNKLFIIIISLLFYLNCSASFAEDIDLLNTDYKNAYIKFNKALEEDKTPVNYLNMCKVTFYLNDFSTAKMYCTKALNLLDKEKKPDSELKSNVLGMLGYIYSDAYHNRSITFDYYNAARELKEKNPDTDKYELARLYLNIGYAYCLAGEYNLAYEYLNRTVKIASENDSMEFHSIAAAAYTNIGVILMKQDKKDEAFENFDNALNQIKLSTEYQNNRINGIVYRNLAYYYKALKDKKNSTENLLLSKKFFDDAFYKNFTESNFKNYSYTENPEQILNEFPYDNLANFNMLIKALLEDNDELINKSTDILLNTNKESSLRYYYIANAYSAAYIKSKNIVFSQNAKSYLNEYLDKYPNKYLPSSLYLAGCIYLDLGSIYKAEKYFKKALKQSSSLVLTKYIANQYIDAYNRTKKEKYADKAVKYLEKLKKNDNKI